MAVAHIIFEVFGKKTRLGINPVSQAIEDHENRLSYRTDNSFEVPFKHATALEIWRKLVYVKCIEFDCMRTQVSAFA
jgi:hypothetical protein